MCGIAGYIDYNAEPKQHELMQMADRLAHRGPDGRGVRCIDNVGLVHTRLSIIDLLGGQQPLSDVNDQLHLIANGEIYNYIELREQFASGHSRGYSRGHSSVTTPLTDSDSEQIISAYQYAGVECVAYLHGMYAFALYDKQKQQLLLARDRLGIKPLYYAYDGGRLIFASEIKAILSIMRSSPDIHADALSQFLQNQFSTGRQTIFSGIHRILPGEYLLINTQAYAIEEKQYWSPCVASSALESSSTMEKAADDFGELFEQVMREHMRSDVPFGLFLSGGIDSSLLLAAIDRWRIRETAEPLRTFSVGFEGDDVPNELPQAEQLARYFKTDHMPLKVSRDDMFNRIVHGIWCVDDLMRDFACLPTSLLSERAANDVKVVFSGEGGDEAFAGYRRYAATFDNWLKSIMKGSGGFRTRGQWEKPITRRALNSRLRPGAARAPMRQLWSQTPTSWSSMQRRQAVDIMSALADNLFVKTDRIMMGHGLEGRVPFSDHRIIQFGLSLPDRLKMHGTEGKQLLRYWGRQQLSAEIAKEIFDRPKKGFYVPVNKWLSGKFLNQLEQKLLANRHVLEWFNGDAVRDIMQAQHRQAKYARHIWCIMQFAIWARLFIDSPNRQPGKIEHPLDWL